MSASYRPEIIAHRGASGYIVEHTAEAYAMAHAMGADYLEPDVVLSKDGVPVVLHDTILDAVTDVSDRFPGRARADGRHYVIDFTWKELRALHKFERIHPETGEAVFPNRFPRASGDFRLMSLEEALVLLKGLNRSTGRNTGIYPEIKAPAFHTTEGHDATAAILEVLIRHGFDHPGARCFVQCFDPEPLKRIRADHGDRFRLIQLIGLNQWGEAAVDYEAMLTAEGLAEIATYADGIGPLYSLLLTGTDPSGKPVWSSALAEARRHGLLIHPYTFRADQLPPGLDFETLHRLFFDEAKVDAVFTDFPDLSIGFRP